MYSPIFSAVHTRKRTSSIQTTPVRSSWSATSWAAMLTAQCWTRYPSTPTPSPPPLWPAWRTRLTSSHTSPSSQCSTTPCSLCLSTTVGTQDSVAVEALDAPRRCCFVIRLALCSRAAPCLQVHIGALQWSLRTRLGPDGSALTSPCCLDWLELLPSSRCPIFAEI